MPLFASFSGVPRWVAILREHAMVQGPSFLVAASPGPGAVQSLHLGAGDDGLDVQVTRTTSVSLQLDPFLSLRFQLFPNLLVRPSQLFQRGPSMARDG